MTPETLGNWTYGYIGAALGIDLWMLLGGSWYADATSRGGFNPTFPWSYRWANEMLDWEYIMTGFNAFNAENYRCAD